jgi:aspartate/tyrosine/aromatic aminotransferase
MFDRIPVAPADPILGLTEAFNHDPRPDKINLGVGVYKDADGRTPVLASVKAAERRLVEQETTKNYLPIEGDSAYAHAVQSLLLGEASVSTPTHAPAPRGVATAQCPGGTGALRVAGDYLKANHPGATVWLSDPTWPNHAGIFAAAGVATRTYPYFDPATNGLALQPMLDALATANPGDVVLLHGCCHNPTGVDPSTDQWEQIANLLAQRQLLPLVDFAYQGFGDGLDEDAAGVRRVLQRTGEALVCSSFSKNFGLYNERVGALTAIATTPDAAAAVLSQIKQAIRRNYSNPPAHGGKVVATILADPTLRKQWHDEVAAMRNRINSLRTLFVDSLKAAGVSRDFSFIARQRGMFSFSGLTTQQVQQLREKHAIYIVNSGRISVAGMNEPTMPRLCHAIASILQP